MTPDELREYLLDNRNSTELDLSSRNLTELTPELGELTKLEILDLSGNQLTKLPIEVILLKNLEILRIGRLDNGNLLSELPKEIGQLTKLRTLDIRHNVLRYLPESIGQLSNLRALFLGSNRLTELPQGIGQLTNLKTLYLPFNQLRDLPRQINNLTNLEKLYLQGNNLTKLPQEIGQLRNLIELDLRENPLPIPPEILNKTTEPQAIITWYLKNVLSGAPTRPLNEAKVVLVGQGKVGKTSLVNRLTRDEFNPQEHKTEGIAIHPWQVQVDGEWIRLNLWDFGGQEIMHATHQFFLTKRTVYLLVLDSRQSEQANRVEYWLKLIQSFGGDSPVIIVCNQCDEDEMSLNWKGLKNKYPSLQPPVKRASCKTREGMAEILVAITKAVSALPHIHDALALNWFAVKDELQRLHAAGADYIPYTHYQDLCRTHEITAEQDQKTLLGFLHDLGAVLHFLDHPILEENNVLNPAWVTGGVYAIINHHLLKEKQGVLHLNDLGTILDPQQYPRSKYPFIIQMMQKFEMCHEFPGSNNTQFLISVTLPLEPPDMPLLANPLRFQYRYEVLPESVITRFITRMHAYLDGNCYWRHGVRLKSEDGANQALVQADLEDRKISLAVAGRPATNRDLLKLIRADFYKIHKSFGELAVAEKIPLSETPEVLVDYQHLVVLEEKGIAEFIPEGMLVKVKVKDLLDGIETKHERQSRALRGEDRYPAGPSHHTEIHAATVNLLQTGTGEAHMVVHPQDRGGKVQSAWANGLFYLFTFAVVIGGLGVLAGYVPFYTLAIIIVAGILFIPLIGALQLRQDDRLSEKSFLALVGQVFRQLPLIGRLAGKSRED